LISPKIKFAIILTGLVLSGVVAQTPEWDSTLKLLISVNPEVKAADLQVAAKEEAIQVAGVLPDPKLEFTTALAPVETRDGPIENQLMLGQMFPLWGKLDRQEKIAVLQRDLAIQEGIRTRLAVINRFEKSYAKYIRIIRSLDILNQYSKELESFRTIALTQYATGQGLTQHPILKLQIEQTRIETKTNALNGNREALLQSFIRLFNGQLDTSGLQSLVWTTLSEENNDAWVSKAFVLNPSLNAIKIQESIATLKRELNEKQNLPDLTTGITYTVVGPTSLPGAVSSGKDPLGIKLGLNMPIWFKRNKARVESARQVERSIQIKTTDVENRVTESVESILADLDQIGATVDLYENRLIPEAEQMLSSAYAAYKTGKISFLDLLDSERMVVNLRLDYEQVVANQRIGEANLRKAVGLLEVEE